MTASVENKLNLMKSRDRSQDDSFFYPPEPKQNEPKLDGRMKAQQMQDEANRILDKQLLATSSFDFDQHFHNKEPKPTSEKSFHADDHQQEVFQVPGS
jgi:hypothetical protein